MGWIGVITDAGAAALKRCLTEGLELNINDVKGGSGTTPQANMRQATALVSEKGGGTIVRKRMTENGVEIVARIESATAAYTMTEAGVFGTIDGDDVLIALYQNADGEEVPAASVFPDYAYNLCGTWDIDNMEDLTITVNPSAFVSAYWGPEDAGKYLIINEYGYVEPITVPLAEGKDF